MKKFLVLALISQSSLLLANQYYYQDSYNNPNYQQYPQQRQSYSYSQRNWDNSRQPQYNQEYYYQQPQGYYYQQQPQGYNYQQQPQGYYYQQQPQGYSYQQGSQGQAYQDDRRFNYQERQHVSQDSYNKTNTMVSDEDIRNDIQKKLDGGWFSKGYKGVTFDVRNGNVTLRGNVETQEDKNKIEDTVRDIKGVMNVRNEIMVTGKMTTDNDSNNSWYTISDNTSTKPMMSSQDSAATDSDRMINDKIRNKLRGGWFSKAYDNVTVRTVNGNVTVEGTVEKRDDIQKVTDEIRKVDGVKNVNNRLQAINNK